jgi:predicted alpha/beta-fold hydrolase
LAARVAIWQYRLPSGERKPLSVATTLSLPILLIQNWDDPVTRSAFASRLHVSNPNVRLKRVPQIDKTNPCLDNKGAWGTHVAALPCHPNWTRRTIRQFIESIFPPSIPRSSERPVST